MCVCVCVYSAGMSYVLCVSFVCVHVCSQCVILLVHTTVVS